MSRRTLLAAALLMTLAGLQTAPVAAGSGSANQVITVSVATPSIAVLSNGTSYFDVAPFGPITADVQVYVETNGRLKSFRSWLRLGTRAREELGLTWDDFKQFGHAETFPRGKRPKGISPRLTMTIPSSGYRTMALEQCNALARRLRNEGRPDEEIFGEDHIIELGIRAQLQYDSRPNGVVFDSFGLSDNELSWEQIKKINLVCQRSPEIEEVKAPPHRDPVPPFVSKASLTLLERSGLNGVCKIILSGVIQTSEPNIEVSFRYKDDDGHQSEVFTVTTDHAKTAMFSHEYDVPNNPKGGESGKVRMVGVSHGFNSAKVNYDMNCTAPGPQSFEALLPPKLTMQVIPRKHAMVGGQYCPTEVKIVGKIEGRAEMSGYAGFLGDDNYISPPQAYEVQKGDIVLLGADRELDWSQADLVMVGQLRKLTIQLGFNATGPSNTIVASLPKKDYTFSCMIPSTDVQAGQGAMSGPPRPEPAPAASHLRLAPRATPGAGPATAPPAALRLRPAPRPDPASTPPAPSRPVLGLSAQEPKSPRLRLQRLQLLPQN